MPTVKCPKCQAEVQATDEDLLSGRSIRCSQCGTVVEAGAPPKPQDPVSFPSTPKDETVLDLSDAVKALQKKKGKQKE